MACEADFISWIVNPFENYVKTCKWKQIPAQPSEPRWWQWCRWGLSKVSRKLFILKKDEQKKIYEKSEIEVEILLNIPCFTSKKHTVFSSSLSLAIKQHQSLMHTTFYLQHDYFRRCVAESIRRKFNDNKNLFSFPLSLSTSLLHWSWMTTMKKNWKHCAAARLYSTLLMSFANSRMILLQAERHQLSTSH